MHATEKTLTALLLGAAIACGSSGSSSSTASDGGASGSCPSAQIMCTACDGGGFCAAACPNVSCPLSPDSGEGGTGEGGACPSDASTSCLDCSGFTYCVAGACPAVSCPTGTDGGSAEDGGSAGDGAVPAGPAPPCTGTPPSSGQSCSQPQGCTFGGQCAYCAPSFSRIGPTACATSDRCKWSSQSLPSNGSACPRSLPADGSACGSNVNCVYCVAGGLFSATCSSLADTFTWSVGYTAAQ